MSYGPSDKVLKALADVGATLKRRGKHFVYALPNGSKVTVSSTPGDVRADLNTIADIRHAAGAVDATPKPTTTQNVKRQRKPGRVEAVDFGKPSTNAMDAAFRKAGIAEQNLVLKVEQLTSQLANARWKSEQQGAELRDLKALRLVRVALWWQSLMARLTRRGAE